MNVRELRQLIHDKPDDFEIQFAIDGEVYEIGAQMVVGEWKTIYLGVEEEDLKDSMIEWSLDQASGDEDVDGFGDEDVENLLAANRENWPDEDVDHNAFNEALEAAEAAGGCVGEVCRLPDPKKQQASQATEMM